MKPIIDYIDFRQYMLDYYEDRKRRSAFSWREFSKITGFSSSSYMKVVCDGKSKLSRLGVERVADAMGLTGFEKEFFRAMVKYGQAENEGAKKSAYESMLAIAKDHKVRVLQGDLFEFYDSWRNPVIRELAPLMPGATPGEIAKKCYPEISAAEVRQSLDFLSRTGLLKKSIDGQLEQAETSVIGTPDATRLALRDVNIAAATALQALDPLGREKGLLAGANVVMPNVTDVKYRAQYKLYADKPCLDENAALCRGCLQRRIESIGETVLWGVPGDSAHFFARTRSVL
jgi:uncharacterized protein (TIGR02147 family)